MPENPKIPSLNDRLSQASIGLAKDVTEGNLNPATQYIGSKASEYGESQFDKTASPVTVEEGNLADYRGLVQPRIDKVANAVPRLISKIGTEIVKTPGYLYALGESGLTDKTLAESLDNAWLNTLDNVDKSVKDQFAIYKPKSVREGNLWDNLTSTSFWTDEGVDGAGFLLSMMVPGAALKATGLATKLAKLPGLSKLGQANIELGQATLMNTALESAAETKSIVDNLNAEFKNKIGIETNPDTGQLWTAEEAKEAIGQAAVNTFQMNMGILLVPNMIMNKNLLGRFNTSKTVLDEFRDASGKFVLNNPTAKKSAIKEYSKGIGEATVSEGFIEEAGQTTIENYNSKVALNKTNAGYLEGLAIEYINTLTSTEGQKAILLGSVLGAIGGGIGKKRELKQEAKDKGVLSALLKNNFEGFSVDMNNIIQRDEEGKIKINEITKTPEINYEEAGKVIANIAKEQYSTNLQDLAAINDNKDVYDYIYSQQLSRFALPYLKQEGGIEILNQHIDNSSKLLMDVSKKFTNESDFEENTFKNEIKSNLKDLQKVYNSIYSTVQNMDLDGLSDNPKHIEAFANKLAFTAYAESSKQLYLTKKIKELNTELLELKSSISFDLPQNQVEATKIEDRINNISTILVKSKKDYISIFNNKEREKAFEDFSGSVKKQEETIAKAEKKASKEPIIDTPIIEDNSSPIDEMEGSEDTNLDELIKDSPKNFSDEELTYEAEKNDGLLQDALSTTNINDFNIFKKELLNSPLINKTQKDTLQAHETILKALEGEKTNKTDDNLVSDYLNSNTVSSEVTANEQILINPKEISAGRFRDITKSMSKKSTVVMMHLFDHYYDNGLFKLKRDKDGLPRLDNASDLNIDAINNIQVGDTIVYKLVDINDESKELFDESIKKTIEHIQTHIRSGNKYTYSTKDNFGIDRKHIGIFNDKGEQIGFVAIPHAISEQVDVEGLPFYIDARNDLIYQRKHIIEELEAGNFIESTIEAKGNGNLYTKTVDGKIDPINNVLETIRDKDKVAGSAVFVYSGKDSKLILPIIENPKLKDELEQAIGELGKWGKPGSLYQLVKSLDGGWYPIPVYANLINDKTAKEIVKALSVLTEDAQPLSVVRALNSYIYASTYQGNIIVTSENGITKLHINGEEFTISSILGSRKNEFIKQLKTKRQNIEVRNINSRVVQNRLKDRQTLITNVTTFQGEYMVQPYIEYTNVLSTKPRTNTKEESINVTTPSVEDKTIEEVLKKRNITEDDYNDEGAFKRQIDPYTSKRLDRDYINEWLGENLPGLTLSDVKALSDIKTNVEDAIGLYRDMVIYLFNYSSNKVAYHEAFHGVFRNMLSNEERLDIINELRKTSFKPTQSNLDFIQSSYKRAYSDEQLTYLWYEEILADMFSDYTDTFEPKTLSEKILAFFNKILKIFGIYTKNQSDKVDELFYKINTGHFKSKSIAAKNNIELVNRDLNKHFDSNNYVFSRIAGFTPTLQHNRVKSIGDNFIAEYQRQINKGTKPENIKPSDIYNTILNKYTELVLKADSDTTISDKVVIDAVKVIRNFSQFRTETNKYIGTFGIKITDTNVEYKEQEVIDEDIIDEEIRTMTSHTTKGFSEQVTIPGLKSASTRLKMFLSSIPVIEQGEAKTDIFGFPIYHDFNPLYYYLEQKLTGIYTFDEMLEELDELSVSRPELKSVKQRLLEPTYDIKKDKLELLQNDFKSNFSKQQLSYTLVKFDTDSSTGAVTFKIMDANRQSIGREIADSWNTNLINPARKTIVKHNNDGTVDTFTTDSAVNLAIEWEVLVKSNKLTYDKVNNILLKLGIEFTPSVLKPLIGNKVFANKVSTIIDWYSSETPADRQKDGRKALFDLVDYEVRGVLKNYTQSFNNVENKNIYTVQLPSFASKLLSKLTSKDGNKFNTAIDELRKDNSYEYSNLLKELEEKLEFRTQGFKLNYLDGLKDEKGNSDGSKFTNMSPKDFMAMQLALFDNKSINDNKVTSISTHKYLYITPSDKTMAMIFDATKYDVNLKDTSVQLNSPILAAFYNVVLQEAARIKKQLETKKKVLTGKLDGETLLEHYHYNKSTPPKKNEDTTWDIDSIKWNGQAYKFNHFSSRFNKTFYAAVENSVIRDFTGNVEEELESLKPIILNELISELNSEIKETLDEAVEKKIIKYEKGIYSNIALELNGNTANEDATIRQKIADFALNSWLFNIEASKLLNGDIAQYKPGDIQKRTYQSGSMTIMGNTTIKPKIRTVVVKDVKTKSEFTNDPAYDNINVTDAQVYISPEFYKNIHVMRGTWNDDKQLAYDIAEGIIKNPTSEQLSTANQQLEGIKPFYYGSRFDESLSIQRYEQVKCAMLPLFKSYIAMNPLLAEKRNDMDNIGIDMIAHESAFKAAIGYRDLIESDDFITLELDSNNFGIQVDNPNHTFEESNSSLRQLKMLLLGSIDTTKKYGGISGKEIQDQINKLEGVNIREDLKKLLAIINNPADVTFKNFIVEQLTRRGATENIEKVLSIVDGEFQYTPDLGPTSTAFENLISSIFTDRIIKQKFNVGGSAVQATALGLKYKNLEEQQIAIEANPVLYKLQTDLKWIKPTDGDRIEYAEAIMPAWSKEFFDSNGHPKDNIPDKLRELLIYRIPTEGFHSMLPIRVVKFLPPELGNFIMLPYEITTQFGADFDFDKINFIGAEFYTDIDEQGNNLLTKYEYIDGNTPEAEDKRYKQYLRWAASEKINPISEESFFELSIEEQNNRSARNNRIFDNYMNVLSSKETYPLLIKPSGFEKLVAIKEAIMGKGDAKENFFSSRTQRDFKDRNHTGLGLKGQVALHGTGHAYATMLGLNTEKITEDGKIDATNVFRFNNRETYSLNDLYNDEGELIADEILSMMAAVLDDIKNPIVQALGINQYTVDIWCTIVRAGFKAETAINLITQPVIRELSSKLQENRYQIKAIGQGTNSGKTLLADYKTRLDAVIKSLSSDAKDAIDKDYQKLGAKNLNDGTMEFWRNWSRKHPLNVTSDEEHNKMLAKYYIYQYRVLNNYNRYDDLAKQLRKINNFFSINKEVGPNIENIIDKKYLLNEIQDELFPIKGMNNIDKIDGLNEQYKVQDAALDWFKNYFAYDSVQYNYIKAIVAQEQYKPTAVNVLALKPENRMLINGFIRTYIDYNFDMFSSINNNRESLYTDLPKELSKIKDPRNDAEYYDGKLRQNIFIEQLQVKVDNGIGFITLKGNRIDTQLKNNITDAIYGLWNNPKTKPLIIDLIKHSFSSTGFYTGLNSYHNLIPIDILSEINYTTYRKSKVKELSESKMLLDTPEHDRIIDQLIRNFPKKFTKVFDKTMFNEKNGLLVTNDNLITLAKKNDEMFLKKVDDDLTIYPTYIRIYDNKVKRSLIYKQIKPGEYKYVTSLGKAGRLIEIDPNNDIEKSILRDNNLLYIGAFKPTIVAPSEGLNYDSDEQSNDEIETEVLNDEMYQGEDTNIEDLVDDEIQPIDLDQFFEDKLPPLDIDPNAKDKCD